MKARGTLVKITALTESSLIVHWCTPDHGIVKTVARGARRSKSPFAGKLDLFFRCEIEAAEARRGDLHTLRELSVEKPRLGLRRSYVETLAASYFVKLVTRVAEPETPLPEIADLLERGLDYLEENEADTRALFHFEKQLATILGIREPGTDPVDSLRDVFGSVPKQRAELMERIGGR